MLENHLADGKKSFLVGESLTLADVVAAMALLIPMQLVLDPAAREGLPHVSEWFERCVGLPSFVRRLGYTKLCPVALGPYDPDAAQAEPVAAAAPAKKGGDDLDEDDLFGDDDEDDAAAAKEAAAKAKAEAEKKKKKKEVIEKSLIILEVKPLDDTVDLDATAERIMAEIQQEGLMWKTEYKKDPVAFGIFKLIIGFTIVDKLVSVDNDVVEKIEAMEDMVQSVDIRTFDKL